MKKNIKKITAVVALTVIGISAFIGITNSKYITKVEGNGEAEIAKWYFDVNENSSKIETINLAETYDSATLVNGKIAPGTKGSFDLIVNAGDSEVGIEYSVDFKNNENKPSNLKFKYNDQELDEIEDYEEFFKGTIDQDDTSRTRTLTVSWEWPYETGSDTTQIDENDEIDTEEGIKAIDYTFDVVVTGKQVIPAEK